MYLFILFSLFFCVNCEYYDTYTGREISKERFESLRRVNLVPWCAIEIEKCDPHAYRKTDLSCNNLKHPSRGTILTPFLRMLPPSFSSTGEVDVSKYGRRLPPSRRLRTDLVSDGRASHHEYTHMMTNYFVYYVGEITTIHDSANYIALKTDCCDLGGETDPMCMSISVPSDDVYLRASNVRCLNLTRPITYQMLGCVSNDEPPARLNLAPPMLDLSMVYGHDSFNAERGRAKVGGLLLSEEIKGKEWPLSGAPLCFNNRKPLETRCHNGSVRGANTLLGVNIVFIWMFRHHNYLARQLAKINPCWNNDKLYYVAREINIAMTNQILYYELLPLVMGYEYLVEKGVIYNTTGHIDDYDPDLEPGVTIDMVTLLRWFHVVQEGRYKMYTNKGKLYDQMSIVDLTLRTGVFPINNTIQGLTQGSFRQPMGDTDMMIDPDMSERSLGPLQLVSDVLAADISKGRALGLPPYNEYRKYCGLKQVYKFSDLLEWMSQESVDVISRSYESPEDIDAYVGVLAEKPRPNAIVGDTLACVISDQMRRFRRADRFWYEHKKYNPKPFTLDQLSEIRKMTIAKFLCTNGDEVDSIQPHAFRLPGHGNEISKCSNLQHPNLEVFREKKCTPGVASPKTPVKNEEKDMFTKDAIQAFLDFIHPLKT